MALPEIIDQLRIKIGDTGGAERETWSAPLLPAGVAKGIVAELLGNARTEWLLEFFKAHPEAYIFWCEHEQSVNPTAFQQRGVGLERILFIHATEDLPRALHRALESGHYPFIVAPHRRPEVKELQRLHLLAGKAKSTVFLMADKKLSQAWPISLQLEIAYEGNNMQMQLQVHRQKYGGPS